VPFVTLYHWDLPQALHELGGWEKRDTAGYFADYAALVAQRLGDRVGHWITLNEPHVVAYQGYLHGRKAPGKRAAGLLAPVSHHLLLAHGLATQALRAELGASARVGTTLNVNFIEPASDRGEDAEAAQLLDGLWHRWYLDPLYRATYPEDVWPVLDVPPTLVRDGDLAVIASPTDFLGLNYYTRHRARAGHHSGPEPATAPAQGRLTTMGWEVYAEGLSAVLQRIHQEYAPTRLYITESGVAYPDLLTKRGAVHDTRRIAYLRDHLQAARAAIAAGVPLHGYFVWSLMDNFEWQHGYTPRFGLVYTDYATQRRIPKDSAQWYARVAATNGGHLDAEGA
jgi:beta-glucosidase